MLEFDTNPPSRKACENDDEGNVDLPDSEHLPPKPEANLFKSYKRIQSQVYDMEHFPLDHPNDNNPIDSNNMLNE